MTTFETFVLAWMAVAVAVFVLLFFVTAPYGRHARRGWGPAVPARMGWLVMEAPSALVFAALFAAGPHNRGAVAWSFLVLWEAHYVHRAFIYPWMLRDRGRAMPLSVVAMAIAFNGVNATINGLWVFDLSGGYTTAWLTDPRFVAGVALFIAGFVINRWSDAKLRGLRPVAATSRDDAVSRATRVTGAGAASATGAAYAIPRGGLYRWVSCPNYLGEIVEWTGWALATWSLPGLAFAVWTVANLAPRARANHAWYRARFADYPRERKALIPGIW